MPRFAALDVGSNALRLRVIEAAAPSRAAANRLQLPLLPAEKDSPTGWKEILSLRAPVRLGSEVFVTGRLTPASIGQACAALRTFREAMDEAGVDSYRATATSAVREASNAATLVERTRREAGIDLEVIEGVEEARLIQLAVARRLNLQDRRAMLVDVGGGSTELTFLDRGHTVFAMSLPLGTVRLLETFLRGNPQVERGQVDRGRAKLVGETIDRALGEALPHRAKVQFDVLIGTGGSVETMADLCPAASEARGIDVGAMRVLLARLSAMTTAERREAYDLRPDRADTIIPAASIFLKAAEAFKVATISVPGAGLKEGILEELVDKHFDVWDSAGEAENVLAACERLGRRFQFDEPHGQLVCKMAAQLFDVLQPLHAFGERERLLLQAAALLHDIGDFVRYDAHHKHSYYLIQHSDIMGLSPEERAIVANTARYHRKSLPDPSHVNFRELSKDARGKVRGLSAILRIADALDREHRGKVGALRGELDESGRKLVLFLSGADNRELEEWTVKHKSEFLRDVFDVETQIAPPEKGARTSPTELQREPFPAPLPTPWPRPDTAPGPSARGGPPSAATAPVSQVTKGSATLEDRPKSVVPDGSTKRAGNV